MGVEGGIVGGDVCGDVCGRGIVVVLGGDGG